MTDTPEVPAPAPQSPARQALAADGPAPGGQAPGTVVARPRKSTRIAWVMAVAVLAIFSAVATALHGPTDGGRGTFQAGDQYAMIGLGILGALGILMFTRPRVEADARGIRIRNLVGGYDLPWEVVRAVRFGRGSPWASLELEDDDLVSMMAVQAADKGYAVATVRALRALLAAHQAAAGSRPGG